MRTRSRETVVVRETVDNSNKVLASARWSLAFLLLILDDSELTSDYVVNTKSVPVPGL